MKKRIKRVSILLFVFILAFSFGGCKKKEVETDSVKKESSKKETKKEEPKEEIPANQNLLTGLPDLTEEAIGKRPVAVMVNNVADALPQYGISDADVIFEIPVEGDATRLMALYADYTAVPQICAIRSCRYYFPAFSQGFDAFYVNWGIDDTIAEYLEALQLDQYDGIANAGGFFGRDEDRLAAGYSLEHTGYFDGTQFASVVQADGRRTDLSDDKKGTAFPFNGLSEQLKAGDSDCNSINLNFGAQTSQFTYDADQKVYLKQHNNNPHVDGRTQEQLAFTNVFVLETTISVRDGVGHKDLDWGGGQGFAGYYISNGGIQKITWEKEDKSEKGYLRFYDESGNEISLNRGKTYIAVNYQGQAEFN